jgi:nitrite transporter NirC
MVLPTIEYFEKAAVTKVTFLKQSLARYFILSMMAGMYVGFGIVLIFSIGGPLKAIDAGALKAVMGASFGIALTLVIFAGSELFTGNNMICTIGSLSRRITWADTLKIWTVSFVGNLAGALLLAFAVVKSGLATAPATASIIGTIAGAKMTAPFSELLLRGVLCNILVCLAVWTAARATDDTAKLLLIFWCLFGFIGSGFEHSIANMSLLGIAVMLPQAAPGVSWAGFAGNLLPVTLGNIIGGAVIVGAAYWYVAQPKRSAVA